MKKFKYIVAALLLSLSFTACTSDVVPPDTSMPVVDIVQRSELLDMVNIDYLLDGATKKMLADKGVSVAMSGFELTADDMAQFKLEFVTDYGTYTYKFNTAIAYTALANGKFDNIRLYWGNVEFVDDGLLITSLYDYAFLPLNEKVENFTPHHLTFVKDKGGYIVHSAAGFGQYAFVYKTMDEEGIAVFDKSGKMLSNYTWQEQNKVDDIPFRYSEMFEGEMVDKNLFLKQNVGQSISDFELYNAKDNILYTHVDYLGESLTVGDTQYSICEIYIQDVNYYGGLALRKENGVYTGAVLYDTKGYHYRKQSEGEKLTDENGKLVYHNQFTGLRFTIDFETDICEKDYLVTEDMLNEKIATSKDKNYSLYEYGKYSYNSRWISYLVLKNEKTGQLSFVSDFKGTAKTENVLEAGFFSNGDIYLLTDYDFEIFNADSTADGPVFNVGKKFPLGVKKEDGYRYNNLHAARRDPVDGSFIVVFDHLNENRFYDGPIDSKNQNLFDDKYEVSLLDSDGNIVKTYMTQMPVPAGVSVLNIHLSGDVLTMENVDNESGKTLQKATLNIKTGKFTQVQKWAKN